MIINVLVHEFEYGVGHSKAMIEVLKRIPQDQIQQINIVSYQSENLNENFDHLVATNKISFLKVPFNWIKNGLFRSIFFQIYTLLFWKKPKGSLSISMGVCSFVGDIINVQFCHFLWTQNYFQTARMGLLKKIYKKILFKYYVACEDYVYSKKGLKFVFLSQFMADEFKERYQLNKDQYEIAYSSTDLERFSPSESTRESLLNELKQDYPQLRDLDIKKPVSLFAGAYERKGLLNLVPNLPENHQLIIIGSGERGAKFPELNKRNYFKITFTKEISKFYAACDLFIFPTIFEPFGLVIMEAVMSGMKVLVSKKHVGATELLEDVAGVELIDPQLPLHRWIEEPQILDKGKRLELYKDRVKLSKKLSWDKCCQKWLELLNLLVDKNRT